MLVPPSLDMSVEAAGKSACATSASYSSSLPAPLSTAGAQPIAQDVTAWLSGSGGWGESNAALVTGNRESLLIDTLWDLPRTARMLEAFRPKLESAPISRLVNTHADGDHWFGNQLAGAGQIIATRTAARAMKQHGPGTMRSLGGVCGLYRMLSCLPLPGRRKWGISADYLDEMIRPFQFQGIQPVRPTTVFSGKLPVEVGGRQLVLIEVGPAHTLGDLVVHLPDAHTVFAGDILFYGTTPVLWDGSSRNWMKACERILALQPEIVLPGHGPVTDSQGVEDVRRYWEFLRAAVKFHYDRGHTASMAARSILRRDEYQREKFARWDLQERIVINVHAIYRRMMGKSRRLSTWARLSLMREAAVLAEDLKA